MSKHLVLLLHAGDYREASRRRHDGEAERYRHHGYAIDTLEALVRRGVAVKVVQLHSPERYDERGAGGLRFVGLGHGTEQEAADGVAALLDEEAPSHVMLRSPSVEVLREIVARPVRAGVVLADSFLMPVRQRRRYRDLRSLLSDPRVELVANHHLNSTRQVRDVLGVDPSKVVAWDWPLDLLELARSSARGLPATGEVRLCYVGSINRSKGVWDVVGAVGMLRRQGVDARLEIAGAGASEELVSLVERLGLADVVHLRGRLGGDEVIAMMRASTFVCVPSRHSYPEGLPLTIFEAMASGTPLIASDHPMFRGIVRHRETGFVFRSGPGAARRMARTVRSAVRRPVRYRQVSTTSADTYRRLGLPVLWGDLVSRWVHDEPDDREWLAHNSLAGQTEES